MFVLKRLKINDKRGRGSPILKFALIYGSLSSNSKIVLYDPTIFCNKIAF